MYTNKSVCVCVCVCVYIYIYMHFEREKLQRFLSFDFFDTNNKIFNLGVLK